MLRLLADVRSGGRQLAPALDRALRGLEPREARAFVTDLSYGTLRHERLLEAALAPRLTAPERLPERVRLVLLVGAYERLVRRTPAHAAVHAWVEAVKRGPAKQRPLAGLVNAVLRRLDPADIPSPAGAASLPGWLFARFQAALGPAAAERAALGMLQSEPLWLSASDPAAASACLRAEGADVGEGPLAGSLRVRAPRPLGQLAAYRQGLIQPQNPASLAVVRACGEVAGRRVLDLCSGHGVKAAALAAAGADVTSVERDEAKLRAAGANAARLGVRLAQLAWDLRTPPPLAPAPVVLLDAPCSGTGTLRGHPEISRRLTPDAVTRLADLQALLLRSAVACLAPGGRLVYAVCTLTPEEGPEQLAALLAEHPELRALPTELPLCPTIAVGPGRFVLPEDGLDGFFVATITSAQSG